MVHIGSIRIGNLLKKDGIVFNVTPVILIDIMRNPRDYDPVGIEEGIQEYLSPQDQEERGGVKFVNGMCVIQEAIDFYSIITGIGSSVPVTTFHALQNVYNAVTNMELKIVNCQ